MVSMNRLRDVRDTMQPGWRGALFYATHWGAIAVFAPFINVYFVQLGLNNQEIGWLSALLPLATLIFAPLLSAAADRWRWRVLILQLSLVLTLLSFLPFLWPTPTFTFLLVLMSAQAVMRSPAISLGDTLVTRMAVHHQLNFGNLRLWGSLSFATVAIIGGSLWGEYGYRPMFLVTLLLYMPVVWLAGGLEEGQSEAHPAASKMGHPAGGLWRNYPLWVILIANFLAGIGINLTFTFDGVFMHQLGGNGFMVGLMFGLAAFCELPSMQYSQWITQKLAGPRTLILSLIILAIALMGYTHSFTAWHLLLFAAVRGVGFGLFLISTIRLVDELAPAEWASTAQSLRNAGIFGLAALLAGPAGGWLYDTYGPRFMFWVGSFTIIGAGLLVFAVMKQGSFHKS